MGKKTNCFLTIIPLPVIILILLGALAASYIVRNPGSKHTETGSYSLAYLQSKLYEKFPSKNLVIQDISIHHIKEEPYAFVTLRNSTPSQGKDNQDFSQYLSIYHLPTLEEVFMSSTYYTSLNKIEDINKDGTEEIILDVENGVNCDRCRGISILKIQGEKYFPLTPTTDNSKEFVSGKLKDLDKDGTQELLVNYTLSDFYHDFAPIGSPFAYRVYDWKDGEYQVASDEFDWYYQERIKELKDLTDLHNPLLMLHQLIVMLLYYHLKGQIGKGWRELLTLVKKYKIAKVWKQYEWKKWGRIPNHRFEWYVDHLYSLVFPDQPGPIPWKEILFSDLPDLPSSGKEALLSFFSALSYGSNLTEEYWGSVAMGRRGFEKAYQYLSPHFKEQTSFEEFYQSYKGVANVKLLQVYRVGSSNHQGKRKGRFFVEVRTTEEIPDQRPKSGLVWYAGSVTVVQVGKGWLVDGIELKPEDMISQFGGHQPWRGDPIRVAGVKAKEELESIGIHLTTDLSQFAEKERYSSGFRKVTFHNQGRKVVVWVVYLFNERWRAIKVSEGNG